MTWDMVPLGEVADLVGGGTPKRSDDTYWGAGVDWITSADIAESGEISARAQITRLGVAHSTGSVVPAGSVLLVTRTAVGKTCITDRPIAFSQDIVAFTNHPRIKASYLRHFLRSSADLLKRRARGATILGVTRGDAQSLQIPLPPLPEQRRIAAILDEADQLRHRCNDQLELLRRLPSTTFSVPADAPRRRLEDGSIIAGQYGLGAASVPYSPDMPRYVRITDITEHGELNQTMVSPAGDRNAWSNARLQPGDLLFARSGATVGKTYRHVGSELDHVFAGYLIRFRPDPNIWLPEYLEGYFRSSEYWGWVERHARTVAQPNINAKQYGSMLVPAPPLALQLQYAARIATQSARVEEQRRRAQMLDQLFASLQHRAFRGEL